MRLGDLDALKDRFSLTGPIGVSVRKVIDKQPAIDAVPVVRCKDCYLHGECMTEDSFHWSGIQNPYCAAGKKKGGPENGAKPY